MSQSQPVDYRQKERSDRIAPAYLYLIDHGGRMYWFTNRDTDISVSGMPAGKSSDDPQPFRAAPIDHDIPETESEMRSREASVILGVTDPEFRIHFLTAPPDRIRVYIWRANSAKLDTERPQTLAYGNDLRMEFTGVCEGISFGQSAITARFKSELLQDERRILRYNLQPQCNHQLYGFGCGVRRDLHKWTGVMQTFNRSNRSIDLPITEMPNGAGAMVAVDETTFENGYLNEQTNNRDIGIVRNTVLRDGGDNIIGVRLYMQWWPPHLAAGIIVNVFKGCSHYREACRDSFNNMGGQRAIPATPTELRLQYCELAGAPDYTKTQEECTIAGGTWISNLLGWQYPMIHGGGNYAQPPKVKINGTIMASGEGDLVLVMEGSSVKYLLWYNATQPATIEFPFAGGFGGAPDVPIYNPATDGIIT